MQPIVFVYTAEIFESVLFFGDSVPIQHNELGRAIMAFADGVFAGSDMTLRNAGALSGFVADKVGQSRGAGGAHLAESRHVAAVDAVSIAKETIHTIMRAFPGVPVVAGICNNKSGFRGTRQRAGETSDTAVLVEILDQL